MKIFLSGGGTLGPVVPLLAVAEQYRRVHPDAEFVWVGTGRGPEREIVEKYKIPFFAITSGKWRRYLSLSNIFDPFRVIAAVFQSFFLLWQERPDLLISAGGYVSVPLHLAAVFLGVPAWVHQQDLRPGMANKIMSWTAKKITTALRDSVEYYPENKTEWLGNPVRDLRGLEKSAAKAKFNIPAASPVIFALGGGTGSARVNGLVLEALPGWPREWHLIHLTGKERSQELSERAVKIYSNYHAYQFFTDEMKDAYSAADVVVARAGFATITELASLAKPAVLIPMSNTHQEENAALLKASNAAVVLDERTDSGLKLGQIVKDLMEAPDKRRYLGERLREVLPPAPPQRVVEIIDGLIANRR